MPGNYPAGRGLELERGRAMGIALPEVRSLPWIDTRTPEGMHQVPTVADLGVVILDERRGRLYAESLKLSFTGTLGILLRAKAEGRIARIEPVLDQLDRLGFRLSSRTRKAVLERAGEGGVFG